MAFTVTAQKSTERPGLRNPQGFSVTELLVVVTIILVTTAAATPTLVRTVQRYRAEASARNIANIIMRARLEAIKRNQRLSTIFVPPSGGKGARYGIDLNGNGVLDATEPQIMAASGVTFWQDNTPAIPPTTGLPADYTSLAAPTAPSGGPTSYSVSFSPQGTVVVNNAGNWQLASKAMAIAVSNGASISAGHSSWLITITPAAHIRMFFWENGAWRND